MSQQPQSARAQPQAGTAQERAGTDLPRSGTAQEPRSKTIELWSKLDLITPMALRVAATLKIADHVAAGAERSEDLAARTGAHPDALARLMRYLVARGVFELRGEDRFGLNALAEVLLDEHPTATRRWIELEGFGGRMDLAFFDLLATVRDGRPPAPVRKEDLDAATAASYDDVMEAQSRSQAPGIVAAFDWTPFAHVVDVGGGTGTLLAAVLRASPRLRGTLVELPETVAAGRRRLDEEGLADRCQILAGSLFEIPLPRADLYILKFVLHGFDDDSAVTALGRCAEAATPKARVLVIERTLTSDDEDRSNFTSMDLRMLILGHGRERTLEQYNALAGQAGLSFRSLRTPASPWDPHLIEYSVSGR